MDIEYFGDQLFDALNESDILNLADIKTEAQTHAFIVKTNDNSQFIILLREAMP